MIKNVKVYICNPNPKIIEVELEFPLYIKYNTYPHDGKQICYYKYYDEKLNLSNILFSENSLEGTIYEMQFQENSHILNCFLDFYGLKKEFICLESEYKKVLENAINFIKEKF